jgi:hypothetical protein
MNRSAQIVAMTVSVATAMPVLAQSGLQLYASEFTVPTRFFSVDPVTGQSISRGTTRFSPGMDFRRNGTLYGSSSSLVTINPANGQATTVGNLPDLITSIAFSPSDQLYGVSNDGLTLYHINPATGASLGSVAITGTVFPSGGSFPGEITGIDFGPDGTLYASGFGAYRLNVATGVASRITPLGQYAADNHALLLDLDFAPDGFLRAPSFESPSRLQRIDPATGLSVGSVPMGFDMDGLASIPAPGAWATLAAAGVLGSARRRRR